MARTRRAHLCIAAGLVAMSSILAAAAPARAAGSTSIVSVSARGGASNGYSSSPSASADGSRVAFTSSATNLSARDGEGNFDIFVRDRRSARTIFASPSNLGGASDGHSIEPALSGDGLIVAFSSDATNLIASDANGVADIYVRDLAAGVTERISVDIGGDEADGPSGWASISGDGRYVAFESSAGDLVAGDTNGVTDVFVRDRAAGTTRRVSVSGAGAQAADWSIRPAISSDGRFVVFTSAAANLVAEDTNGEADVFIADLASGAIERVSVSSAGAQAVGGWSIYADVSDDGRYVSFTSDAANLTAGDMGARTDVYLRDRVAGTTTLVSRSPQGIAGNGYSATPSISSDGASVAFESTASDLVAGDLNISSDVFVYDARTEEISLASRGVAGLAGADHSLAPSIAADGASVAFASDAINLVLPDLNRARDVFIRSLR